MANCICTGRMNGALLLSQKEGFGSFSKGTGGCMNQQIPKGMKVPTFRTLDKAEEFMNNVITVTSHSPKKFRPNYVHMMQEDAMQIFNCIFVGNELRANEEMRRKYQMMAKIHIRKLTRLLERAQRVMCITPIEEADLGQQLAELNEMFDGWAGSKKI